MHLVHSIATPNSEDEKFETIEKVANQVVTPGIDQIEQQKTLSLLWRSCDIEAEVYEVDEKLTSIKTLLEVSYDNSKIKYQTYRFKVSDMFGYLFILYNIPEDDDEEGQAYQHIAIDEDGNYVFNSAIRYTSPLNVVWTKFKPTEKSISRLLKSLDDLGYEIDKIETSASKDTRLSSWILHDDKVGNNRLIDLRVGATLDIAHKVESKLVKKYSNVSISKQEERYTIIAKDRLKSFKKCSKKA